MNNSDTIFSDDIHRLAACDFWEKLSKKTLCITGVTGMLGAYLALAASKANENGNYGIKLIFVCRDVKKAKELYEGVNCKILFQDIREPLGITEPVHYLIHAAGPVGPSVFQDNPFDVLESNTTGIFSLLKYAASHECEKFVFASTHEVYGQAAGEQAENMMSGAIDPMDPRAGYVLGKQAAENALACYYKQHALHIASARLSRLYGPKMNMNSGLFICDFINDAINKRPIRVRGGLNLLRPICYIADAAEAMMRILVYGNPGDAYNVQGDELPTIGEISGIIAERAKSTISADHPETAELSPIGHWLNTDRLKKIGWRQNVRLENGLARTLEYYSGAATCHHHT